MAKGCSKRGKRQKIQRMNNGLIYSRPSLIISNISKFESGLWILFYVRIVGES